MQNDQWYTTPCDLKTEIVSDSKEVFFRQIKMLGDNFSQYQVWLFKIQISIPACESVDPWTEFKA